jgi:hypothetical protein
MEKESNTGGLACLLFPASRGGLASDANGARNIFPLSLQYSIYEEKIAGELIEVMFYELDASRLA